MLAVRTIRKTKTEKKHPPPKHGSTGGGRFGPKQDVHTKEDADHSLPYLMAVALLDGDVQPAQLDPSRIEKRDVQDLMQRVTVRPDAGLTARYPADLASRATVRLKRGTSFPP